MNYWKKTGSKKYGYYYIKWDFNNVCWTISPMTDGKWFMCRSDIDRIYVTKSLRAMKTHAKKVMNATKEESE